jgi:hypothetical protein
MKDPRETSRSGTLDTRGGALLRAGRRALREPALLLSLAYIAMSALGLWASYWLYRPFGIPIFQYMQPSDILVAGLRDPAYLLLVAAGFGFFVLVRWWESWRFDHPDRVDRLRRHWFGRLWAPRWRERVNKSEIGRALFGIAFVVYLAFSMVLWYTQRETDGLLRGDGQQVELVYAESGPMVEPAILVGTTANWVFVYWPRQHRAEAIAQQSLRSLIYPPASAAAGSSRP